MRIHAFRRGWQFQVSAGYGGGERLSFGVVKRAVCIGVKGRGDCVKRAEFFDRRPSRWTLCERRAADDEAE